MGDANVPATPNPSRAAHTSALRLVRVIVLETILIGVAGMLVWGVAWEVGFFKLGLVAAIVIWLTVSPVIEIATVMNYRRSSEAQPPRDGTRPT